MFSILRQIKFNSKPYVPKLLPVGSIHSLQNNNAIGNLNTNQQNIESNNVRSLSIISPAPQTISTNYTKEDILSFRSTFPQFSRDLKEAVMQFDDKFAPEWMEKSLKYNVHGGKNNRGQITVFAFKKFANKSQLTPENIKLAQYIGWCSEMFEAAFFIADDIVDGSEIRRGLPCWYKLKDVELQSINDIVMLENGVFMALKKYIGHTEYYPKIFELFGKANFITYLGQMLDFQISKENVVNHTMNRYEGIVRNKTCYSAFYLPVAFALQMCGYSDPYIYKEAKALFYEIGLFFQIRNDYLDVFGDPLITGKNGTDIQENKISWMAIITMEKANEQQRNMMRDCYGHEDPVKVEKVKKLYEELGIKELFIDYEKQSYNRVANMIKNASHSELMPVLLTIWDTIYFNLVVPKTR